MFTPIRVKNGVRKGESWVGVEITVKESPENEKRGLFSRGNKEFTISFENVLLGSISDIRTLTLTPISDEAKGFPWPLAGEKGCVYGQGYDDTYHRIFYGLFHDEKLYQTCQRNNEEKKKQREQGLQLIDSLVKERTPSAMQEAIRRARELGLDEKVGELQTETIRKHAETLEVSGRYEEAAQIYESLQMYERAGAARRKEKDITVTHVDANVLVRQLAERGQTLTYHCCHCGAPLKIGKQSTEVLKNCPNCGYSLEVVDLAKFIDQHLS